VDQRRHDGRGDRRGVVGRAILAELDAEALGLRVELVDVDLLLVDVLLGLQFLDAGLGLAQTVASC
jgi:hypothetical protein